MAFDDWNEYVTGISDGASSIKKAVAHGKH